MGPTVLMAAVAFDDVTLLSTSPPVPFIKMADDAPSNNLIEILKKKSFDFGNLGETRQTGGGGVGNWGKLSNESDDSVGRPCGQIDDDEHNDNLCRTHVHLAS